MHCNNIVFGKLLFVLLSITGDWSNKYLMRVSFYFPEEGDWVIGLVKNYPPGSLVSTVCNRNHIVAIQSNLKQSLSQYALAVLANKFCARSYSSVFFSFTASAAGNVARKQEIIKPLVLSSS